MKVQISIDDDLMRQVDDFADENYMNRSWLFSVAVTQYINQNYAFKAIQDMALSMRKIADTGKVDADTIAQLEDFERFAKFLVNK